MAAAAAPPPEGSLLAVIGDEVWEPSSRGLHLPSCSSVFPRPESPDVGLCTAGSSCSIKLVL